MREQFPFFNAHPDLTYLDTAATSQKPQVVLDALRDYYIDENANVHRGLYQIAYQATNDFEAVRAQVAAFLHAQTAQQIIFTRGTTDALNLVASGLPEAFVGTGERIVVTGAEHHSNFIPWQQLARKCHADFVITPVDAHGAVDVDTLLGAIVPGTKIVALAHVTNVSGEPLPITEVVAKAHEVGAIVIVDGAQAVAHMPVNVTALDVDFYAFSAHKIYGPTGIGVLYAKQPGLLHPIAFGGEMIEEVGDLESTWAQGPIRFEAGTPNIAGVFGLGAALTWYRQTVNADCLAQEQQLTTSLFQQLQALPGVTVYGDRPGLATVSFNLEGVHPHDLATFLDEANIAVRAGHHCAQPLMRRLQVAATVRASLGVYNTAADVTTLVEAVAQGRRFFDGID